MEVTGGRALVVRAPQITQHLLICPGFPCFKLQTENIIQQRLLILREILLALDPQIPRLRKSVVVSLLPLPLFASAYFVNGFCGQTPTDRQEAEVSPLELDGDPRLRTGKACGKGADPMCHGALADVSRGVGKRTSNGRLWSLLNWVRGRQLGLRCRGSPVVVP